MYKYSGRSTLGKRSGAGPPAGGPLGPLIEAGGAPPPMPGIPRMAPGLDGKSPAVGDLMVPESIDMVELMSTLCPPRETFKPSVYDCCSLLGNISLKRLSFLQGPALKVLRLVADL